jgi:peptidyl-prolyl cis-trans isomerase D
MVFAWLIVFILVIGLAGFGIQDVLRSSGTNEVATFGNQKVSSDDYVRMIQQETQSLSQRFGTQLSFSQAQSLGVAQIALQKLISSAILDQAVEDLGFSQSDNALKKSIQNNSAFSDIAGRFDPQKYEDVLLNVNLQPSEYEEILRKELSRNLLLNLTSTEITMDDNTSKLIEAYILEERVSDVVVLTKDDLDARSINISISESKDFYQKNKSLFMQPETKKISYIYLSPQDISENQDVTDQEIEITFLAQKDTINSPEKRDVDQIFFTDEKSAQTELSSEVNNLLLFEKLLKARGLTKDDVSLGEVIKSELPVSAQEAVFSSPESFVTGPFKTELGMAIYRVNKIIPAVTKTVAELYETIKNDIALEKASAELNSLVNRANDEIAAGASLEDIANTTEMVFGKLDVFEDAELPDFANTQSFKSILQSGRNYASDVQFNDDGGIFSLRIDETSDPFVKDFVDVKELVKEQAEEQKLIATLESKALSIAEEQKQSGQKLLELVQNQRYEIIKNKKISRFAKIDNLPEILITEIFSIKQNESKVVLGTDKVYIVQLNEIISSEPVGEKGVLLKEQISSQFIISLEQDMVSALIDGLESNHSLYISQKAVDIAIERFN